MKKLLSSILIAACLIAAPATFTGCANMGAAKLTPEAVVYYTFKDVQIVAHKAMDVFAEQVVLNKVSPVKKEKIEGQYRQYQAAFKLALTAAAGDLKSPAPLNVQKLMEELVKLIYL